MACNFWTKIFLLLLKGAVSSDPFNHGPPVRAHSNVENDRLASLVFVVLEIQELSQVWFLRRPFFYDLRDFYATFQKQKPTNAYSTF